MKIMLDPGHGGSDVGAVATHTGVVYHESDFNLEIVNHVAERLKSRGCEVLTTRAEKTETVTPGSRFRKFSNSEAKAFVSVHCNSSANPQANGLEIIYRNEEGELLADKIYTELMLALDIRGRGLKNDLEDLKRNLAVLNSDRPSCLVEVGFLSNEKDMKTFSDTEKVAKAIATGIIAWIKATS